ncbi:MAG TPA: hypothetical protein VHN59_01090 [Chitinophagaceae bacterium]|nr:hypothetical protein [Chitinophagaceae bacterium]
MNISTEAGYVDKTVYAGNRKLFTCILFPALIQINPRGNTFPEKGKEIYTSVICKIKIIRMITMGQSAILTEAGWHESYILSLFLITNFNYEKDILIYQFQFPGNGRLQ